MVAAALLGSVSSGQAATLTWDSDGSAANGVTEGGGIWTPGSTASFSNGTANVITANDLTTDIALFGNGGTLASVATINVGNGSINGLIFGATTTNGYTLTNTTASTLSIGASGITLNSGAQATRVGSANLALTVGAAQSWTNNAASLLTISGAVAVNNALTIGGTGNTTFTGGNWTGSGGITKTGAGTMEITGNISSEPSRWTIANTFGGSFTMQQGTLNISGIQYLTMGGLSQSGTYSQSGGTVTFTPADSAGNGVYINNSTTTGLTSSFSLTGGTFTLSGANTQVFVSRATGTSVSGTGNLTIGGGASAATFTAPNISIGATGNTGNIDVNANGVLVASSIVKGAGTGNLYFNGGTLRVRTGTSAGATLLSGLSVAQIKNAGATIDTNGINVTVSQVLANFAGNTGGLTKTGTGTLTLSGANTYTGVTSVTGGVLNVTALNNYGVAGPLGQRASSSEVATIIGLRFAGGTLQYTGSTAQSIDRQIRIATGGGGGCGRRHDRRLRQRRRRDGDFRLQWREHGPFRKRRDPHADAHRHEHRRQYVLHRTDGPERLHR